MEKIRLFILLASFVGFAACENDQEKAYVKPADQVTKPVLSLDGDNDIEISEFTVNMVPAILNWTKADFGADVLTEYTLEMAATESFEGAKSVPAGNNTGTKSLTAKDLSDWAINYFGGLDNQGNPVKVDYYLRVAASVFLDNPKVTVPPTKLYSNSIKLTVLPFYIPSAGMFMIGEEFGNWNWSSEGIVEMIPVHSFTGHFWAIRYLTADKKFKWNQQKAWNGSEFNTLGDDTGFSLDGGDAKVSKSGLYMIYIDMENNKISIEDAKVYGMGDCFGKWEMGLYPFSIVNDKLMTIAVAATSNELRMYAASSISPIGSEWWKMEFIILDGKIAYRGKGNDQERVGASAGQSITLDFNAGTGTIE